MSISTQVLSKNSQEMLETASNLIKREEQKTVLMCSFGKMGTDGVEGRETDMVVVLDPGEEGRRAPERLVITWLGFRTKSAFLKIDLTFDVQLQSSEQLIWRKYVLRMQNRTLYFRHTFNLIRASKEQYHEKQTNRMILKRKWSHVDVTRLELATLTLATVWKERTPSVTEMPPDSLKVKSGPVVLLNDVNTA